MQEKFVVAIDGPAGAGKSTVAKILAKKLAYIYIDTGAMYRAITWKCLQFGGKLTKDKVEEIARSTKVSFVVTDKGVNSVWADDIDVTEAIRTPEVTARVSEISSNAVVRCVLSKQQQEMGDQGGVVMDGRDIGTCIFPNARYKIFLTASVEERARRRCKELEEKGYICDIKKLEAEIAARDYADSHREIAPLTQAVDAVLVDSSALNIEQTVELLYTICRGDENAV